MLTIFNTLSGKKEEFKPLKAGKIALYVCGITPYDFAHVGHARVYANFDVFYRLCKFLGYEVTYCRNFTDIDDKILKKAEAKFGDRQRYADITKEYISAYHADMKQLGCLSPDHEPRVTDNIPEIIAFIQGLIDAEKAYAVDGDVYFEVRKFSEYGKLSRRKIEDLQSGARVEINDKKKNPLDFALWKSEPEGEFWKSPWGYGRPGWHIECSALAARYLGQEIDIHAGGLDLIFPHHENEIAQSESLHGKQFARYWMHNGLVRIDKEKMSKSLGNFFTAREVFKQFDPTVVRFYLLSHHYRTPLEFSFEDLAVAHKSYQRLCRAFENVVCDSISHQAMQQSSVVKKMLEHLTDDVNTQGALGVLFSYIADLPEKRDELCAVKQFMSDLFGLSLETIVEKEKEITTEIQDLIDARKKARLEKDWKNADALRYQLSELGFFVEDKKTG